MAKQHFYVTTPIYYPNDVPHLGHAYSTLAADVLARWHSMLGEDVFFLTGTDEHGKKLESTAQSKGKKPKEYVDALVPEFEKAWKQLNFSPNRFIRTTDKDHEQVVSKILQTCYDNGDIYLGTYEGLYCTSCEAYYTEKDAEDGKCPVHEKKLEHLKEDSYFFKLSKYEKFLLKLYKDQPDFILPKNRKQEVVNRVKEGLKDFSISRTSFDWGIPLPFDKKHVAYVWFDALLNYISGVDYGAKKKTFEQFWPADVHIIGKDIIWFHTVYWPAMLKSAGIDLPKHVFAHGWWTVHNKKMGKSAGNAVKVDQLIGVAGVDSARYFLLRNTAFGDDGDFSEEDLIRRHNTELADKLGNLVSRISGLCEKYGMEKTENSLLEQLKLEVIADHMQQFKLDKALNDIFAFIDVCNVHVQDKKPWESKDTKVLYEVADSIKVVSILLWPFMPQSCERIAKTFGFSVGKDTYGALSKALKVSPVKKGEILFAKIR